MTNWCYRLVIISLLWCWPCWVSAQTAERSMTLVKSGFATEESVHQHKRQSVDDLLKGRGYFARCRGEIQIPCL